MQSMSHSLALSDVEILFYWGCKVESLNQKYIKTFHNLDKICSVISLLGHDLNFFIAYFEILRVN